MAGGERRTQRFWEGRGLLPGAGLPPWRPLLLLSPAEMRWAWHCSGHRILSPALGNKGLQGFSVLASFLSVWSLRVSAVRSPGGWKHPTFYNLSPSSGLAKLRIGAGRWPGGLRQPLPALSGELLSFGGLSGTKRGRAAAAGRRREAAAHG